MPGNSTIAVKGSKSVPILTTGHEKQRITVFLAAMADGTKLAPFVVLKGKRMPKDVASIPNVIVRMSKNAWMDEDLTSQDLHGKVRLCLENGFLCGTSLSVTAHKG